MTKIIYNKLIPFGDYRAINLFGTIFAKGDEDCISYRTINHEKIHTAQMKELLYIPFYILYVLEWFVKLFRYWDNAYHHISFEKEAYKYQDDHNYLIYRKPFAQWRKDF